MEEAPVAHEGGFLVDQHVMEELDRRGGALGDGVKDRLLGAAEAVAGRGQFLKEAMQRRLRKGRRLVRRCKPRGDGFRRRRGEVGPDRGGEFQVRGTDGSRCLRSAGWSAVSGCRGNRRPGPAPGHRAVARRRRSAGSEPVEADHRGHARTRVRSCRSCGVAHEARRRARRTRPRSRPGRCGSGGRDRPRARPMQASSAVRRDRPLVQHVAPRQDRCLPPGKAQQFRRAVAVGDDQVGHDGLSMAGDGGDVTRGLSGAGAGPRRRWRLAPGPA